MKEVTLLKGNFLPPNMFVQLILNSKVVFARPAIVKSLFLCYGCSLGFTHYL